MTSLVGSVGVGTRTTSGTSLTGAYGQSPTAGNLLVAVVLHGGTTAADWAVSQYTGTTGWTKYTGGVGDLGNNTSGTDQAGCSVWTKVAAGADAAPVFDITIGGTVAGIVLIYELSGYDAATPIVTDGTNPSGGTAITIASRSATTSGNVPADGCFAIAACCVERATAATRTYANGGGSWTNDYSGDTATSSSVHLAADHYDSPPSAATLTATFGWQSRTSSYESAFVIVVQPPVPHSDTEAGAVTETGVVRAYVTSSDYSAVTEAGTAAEAPVQVVFDAVGPAGGGGALGTSSPFTFAHVNSSADNAFVVGVTTFAGTANDVTSVTYGGVTIPYLTWRVSNDQANGGIALYGRAGGLGGLPTGSNLVSISFSDADDHLAGSVSAASAGALGTAVTNIAGSVTSVSVDVADTQAGGLVAAVACHGAMGTWSGSGCTLRFSRSNTNSSGSDNIGGGTAVSTTGTQSVGFSHDTADWWAIAAVEIRPPAVVKSGTEAAAVTEAASAVAFVSDTEAVTVTEAGSVTEVTGGPPQVVAYTHTAFTGTGSQNSTEQVSWAAGDLIVVIGGDENGQSISAPAATGLSFAALGTQIGTAGSACGAHAWVAAPSAPGGPVTVSGTGASTNRWGFGIWVLRGWTARTRTNGTVDTGQTVSVSRSGSHSLVLAGLFDWSAGNQTGSWTPAGANVRDQNLASGFYGWFLGDWPDQGDPGTLGYGVSVSSTGEFTKVCVEVAGTAGASGPSAGTEAARVSEAAAVRAALGTAEAAALTEGQGVTAYVSSAEAARASETATVTAVAVSGTDAAAAVEAQGLTASLSQPESARGTEAQALTASLAGTDAAAASEAASTSALASAADVAQASEAASVSTILVAASEAARLSEAQSLIASLSALDTAQAAEAGSIGGQSVASADSSGAAESQGIRASLSSAEAATVTDAGEGGTGGGVAFSADSAVVTEAAQVTAYVAGADAAQAAQASEILRTTAPEAALAAETALVSGQTLTGADAAAVSEAGMVTGVAVSSSESAACADQSALTAQASDSDQVTEAEGGNVRASLTGTDQVRVTDAGEYTPGAATYVTDAETWHIEDSGFYYLTDSDSAASAEGTESAAVASTERGGFVWAEWNYWPVAIDGARVTETEHVYWSGSLSDSDTWFAVVEGGEAIAPWHLSDTDAFTMTEHPVSGEDVPYIHLLTFAPTVREVFGGYLITAQGRPVLFSPAPTRQFLELAWEIHRSETVWWVSAAERCTAAADEQAAQAYRVAIVVRPALDVRLEVS